MPGAMAPPSTTARQPSPFLALPAELRNEVYGLLYPSIGSDIISIIQEPRRFLDILRLSFLRRARASQAPNMALLQTCHQVHDEVEQMVYKRTHFGLFLVDSQGRRHPTQHMRDQIESFGNTFANRAGLIQHLDLGVQDLGTYVENSIIQDGGPSMLQITAVAQWIGGHLISPSMAEITARSSRMLLAKAVKDLSAHLPNIRCITIHDSVADQLGGRETFLRHLTSLFPKLNELRVFRLQPGFGTRRYRVEGNHLLTWEDGADLGRLLLGQTYQDL